MNRRFLVFVFLLAASSVRKSFPRRGQRFWILRGLAKLSSVSLPHPELHDQLRNLNPC